MDESKDKMVTLRVLLIKASISDEGEIFKDFDKLKHVKLSKQLAFKGLLAWKGQIISEPSWLTFVKPYLDGEIDKLKNSSTAAVLLLEAEKCKFAFTFGHGRNLLNPEAYRRDFGLKVTLNTVNPASIRSIDCRNFEELTVQTRRQTSRASTLDTFGLNATQDLLRQVVGEPTEKEFAKRVAGSDGLMFAARLSLPDLGKKCKELLKAYKSTVYREHGFSFIDYLHRERDPSKISELDQLLVDSLVRGSHEQIHLAPPEPIDMTDVDKFVYSMGKNANQYDELEVCDLITELGGPSSVTIDALKHQKIGVIYGSGGFADLRWSAYSSIVYETNHDGAYFVLTCGEWFEVQKSFVKTVERRVKELAAAGALKLPDARPNQSEANYNNSVQKAIGFVLLDTKCSRAMGSQIEVCDLFTPNKQFVHVKRKSRSATLSHLFSQGVISAGCFLSDENYRGEVKSLIAKTDPALSERIEKGRPKTSDYEIVYAILSKPMENWPLSLPFFSQLNLMNAADHLERMQFKVSLVHVNQK
jgi:uncharacterized protein (TIGR04141 family)